MDMQRILFLLIIEIAAIGSTNTSTVCYGPPGLSCTTHRLSCPSPLVIQIINTSYGYRSGCNDTEGKTDCNKTCCDEEPDDCFVPFETREEQQVLERCNGNVNCSLPGYRRYNTVNTVCNGSNDSAYSKIQYDCVTKGTVSTLSISNSPLTPSVKCCASQGDADDNTGDAVYNDNTGSIVGGIFGAIIIIVIIIVVVLFLYKRKTKLSKEGTQNAGIPQYFSIDDPVSVIIRKDKDGYDEIELDSESRLQANAVHLHQSTINNRKSGYEEIELEGKAKRQTTDNYDHVGDDKLKVKSQKDLDNYNHIGTYDHSVHEDNYNHIGNNLSLRSNHLDADYNHINGLPGTSNGEDDYNHIGDNDNNNVITDDNYHHIGSGDIKMEEGDDSDAPHNLATC
ncbi:hypothetical protein LOTGIDRAFT_155308 [Lottia gigantea]|uniref:SUEL-type lectin domain-containing protein n=1 Tax=Lottia gigantea TaxID=225164 RepID=V3ZIG1_LOTGI|nr:hypothetical protein LOTGIDRAFT_155308 [Lottia gigantea]ESO83997.1 hypothetical protein LOTGIDRAFT_155308 [Lottia gigantea]